MSEVRGSGWEELPRVRGQYQPGGDTPRPRSGQRQGGAIPRPTEVRCGREETPRV